MAISVPYRKPIPYPFDRVLAQYFDLEHFETVHPKTLGQCRVLEVAGNRVLFEQRWPVWLGIRLRTTIEQLWVPPDQIRFHFLSGFLRGVAVATQLTDQGETTEIEETYRVPLVPAWSWLRPLVGWVVERGSDGIWAEDLAVELCHGGWPGIPGQAASQAMSDAPETPASIRGDTRWVRVAERGELTDGHVRTVAADGRELVLWLRDGQLHALDSRCSHTQGPLGLGWLEADRVVCPWHGARFALADGQPCGGPADRPISTYPVRQEGRGVFVQLPVEA